MASDLATSSDANRGIIAELLGKGSQISQDISVFFSTRFQGALEPSGLLDDKKYLVSRHLAEGYAERGIWLTSSMLIDGTRYPAGRLVSE